MVQISSLVTKKNAKSYSVDTFNFTDKRRAETLQRQILQHFDAIHSIDKPLDLDLEKLLLNDELEALGKERSELNFIDGLVTFSPSSASKCERELYYKAMHINKEENTFVPFQRRWTRNGSAVHGAVQKDLLYAEKYLKEPLFNVLRTKTGKPAWEKHIQHVKHFTHNGVQFQLFGMMDGILIYNADGKKIGFEFKTKSTTIGVIGEYKMKEANDSHREQCIAYSLLFGLNEFLIVYESLAKDNWKQGASAKPDMRAFYIEVKEHERKRLLDKFAFVANNYYKKVLPSADLEKCIFCPYKETCRIDGGFYGEVC